MENDHVLVYGNSDVIKKALAVLSRPLSRPHPGGNKFSLDPECLMVPSAGLLPVTDSMATLKAAALKYGGGIKAQKVYP